MDSPSFDLAALAVDPAPHFAAFRAAPQWVWAEPLGMHLVSRYSDVVAVDENPGVFSTEIPDALLTRTLGLTMIRQEGPAHRRLRSASGGALKRAHVVKHWGRRITELTASQVAAVADRSELDLVADFASPVTDACLREVLGLEVAAGDVERWSDAFIGGLINNTDDPGVWATAAGAVAELTDVVAAAIARVRHDPDASVVSGMVHARAAAPLTAPEITSNIALMIAGGFNDARDAIATLPWLLLTHPDTAARVVSDPEAFERAVDECVRWLSPVGSYPRILTCDFTSPAVRLRAGDRVLVLAASANWDETRFPDPHAFDIDRANLAEHLGFSVGPHFCLGSQLVRAMLRAAVPAVLALPGIRAVGVPEFVGWQFRGPRSVPVALS